LLSGCPRRSTKAGISVSSLLAEQRADADHVDAGQLLARIFDDRRRDAAVENIVGRLSLEPTISAARWQVRADIDLGDRNLIESEVAG
jgi:hypothetical protein